MVRLVGLRAYWRFVVVLYHFLPLLVGYARDRRRFLLFGPRRRVTSEIRIRRAEALLDSLLTLGPTFIKLGQLLSTRPDVLPPEYIDVLSQLQDRVPPAPWTAAKPVLEEELGPVEEAFDTFETEAISGASLGQVYYAELDGEAVAVKVRRPNIEPLVEADLRVIRWTVPVISSFVDEARAFSLSNLADEFARVIREEMDYRREARMLDEIRANFADDPKVAIPGVIKERSTTRVLTMEYISGTKITEIEELDELGVDRQAVAERLQRAYLEMIIEDGVFQADPHPGNLAVKPDGTVVFYDFGMSGRVDDHTQGKIIEFYVAVANRDIEAILDALIELGTLSPSADRATMAEVMELAIQDARGEQIETYRVQQIVERVEGTIYEFPLRLPSNLALVLRVATVVEGVCITLDPDFDFIAVATDFLTERGYREESIRQFVEETGGQVRESAMASLRTPPKLERMLDRFDRNDFYVRADIEDSDDLLDRLAGRLILGMVLAAAIVAAALVYPALRPTAVTGVLALLVAILLYRSFTRRRGVRGRPQFTRYEMRERQRER